MDIDEAVTVIKLKIEDSVEETGYLMIGWQADSFEMFLYIKDKVWRGQFTYNRLAGFSRNLHMTEADYFRSVKRCLSQELNVYCYELKCGFFYWKRKLKDSFIIEGFLPMEIDTSAKYMQPDLIEILLAINKQLKTKANRLQSKYNKIKADYQKCLNDTEEFLDLKIEMEKSLCEKFMTLLHIQKTKVDNAEIDTNEYFRKPEKVNLN